MAIRHVRDFNLQEALPSVSLHESNLHHLDVNWVQEVRLDLQKLLEAESLRYVYIGCNSCSIVSLEQNSFMVDGDKLDLTIRSIDGLDHPAAYQLERLGLEVDHVKESNLAHIAKTRFRGPKYHSDISDSHLPPKRLSQISGFDSSLKEILKASKMYTHFGKPTRLTLEEEG